MEQGEWNSSFLQLMAQIEREMCIKVAQLYLHNSDLRVYTAVRGEKENTERMMMSVMLGDGLASL